MSDERPALEWYRSCIHERQRRASTLSIEVGLHSDDKDDADSLAETMAYLDEAIAILEQADAACRKSSGLAIASREPHTSERLMDDLGHSMALFALAPMRSRDTAVVSIGAGWRSASVEESLRFFE